MKKRMIILLMTLATLSFAEGKPQITCPVMGGKINKALYADVKGYRIYVCCKGCIEVIKADPKKMIEKMTAEGIDIGKTPKKSGDSKKWFK